MRTAKVFVEGESDRLLIERLLADLRGHARWEVVVGDGHDAARPLARTHLVLNREPVALVLDADTTNEQRVTEQQRALEDYMRLGGGPAPFAILQFVPESEVLFFDRPKVLERLMGRALAPELVAAGRGAPRQMLHSLHKGTATPGTDLVGRLTEEDLTELRKNKVVAQLRRFVERFGRD